MVGGQIASMQCALLHCRALHASCHADETLTLLPPSVLASLRFLGLSSLRAAPTAGEQFDLVSKLHDLLHAGGGAANASPAEYHPHFSKLEVCVYSLRPLPSPSV